jgi:hypothetical protein
MPMNYPSQVHQKRRYAERYPNVRLLKSAGGKKFIYDNRKGRDSTIPVAKIEGNKPFEVVVNNKVVARYSTIEDCLGYAEERLLPK